MKRNTLEPGLLPVFRLFVGLQVGFFLFESLHLRYQHQAPPHPLEASWTLAALGAVLLIYLAWPGLERRLGAAYLPIALAFNSLMPYVGQVITMSYGAETYIGLAEELGLILIFPLLLISWQYRFRVALVFSLITMVADHSLMLWVTAPSSPLDTDYSGFLAVRTIMCLVLGFAVSRLITAQRQQRQALARANVQLAQYATTLEQLATSRERNRLARELHDTLAHTLSGLAVELEAVKTLWDTDSGQAHALVEHSLTATRAGLTETRRALQALRAAPLEDLGLILALRALAESTAAQTGAQLTCQLPDRVQNLSPAVEQCIYRVAAEALANASKHAGARQLTVRLTRDDRHLMLEVCDDGCGFDLAKVDAERHLGLRGMCERAELIGGRLEVESRLGVGTTIRLRVEEKDDTGPDLR